MGNEEEVIEDDYSEVDFDDEDDGSDEELFRENPLKALWIKLGEIKEMLEDE